jgi:hypothetical protein
VPTRKLHVVLSEFDSRMRESRRLARYANKWSMRTGGGRGPFISPSKRDSIIEWAFLRAFLAWEVFLEKSFVVYLCGEAPSRGRAPKRYYFPPNYRMAMDWLTEGREYAKWANPVVVAERATRHFAQGYPFAPVLESNQSTLKDASTIRNMIAHESGSARAKFEKVVRQSLGTLPVKGTPGAFLSTTVPRSTPPLSFLEFYVGKLEWCAEHIIRR